MKYLLLLMLATAVAVGGAGFYFTQNGYELDFEQLKGQVVERFEPPPPPVEALIKQMAKSEASLNRVYDDLGRITPEDAAKRGTKELQKLESSYQLLGEHEQLEPKVERESQMIVLRSHFVASKMLPSLRESFGCKADKIVALRPESDDAGVARVLDFCTKHDLHKKADRNLLLTVAKAAHAMDIKHGVGLYSLVAHEMWMNGQPESAGKVLETGIKQYKKNKAKLRLVNQLIDQGHREPPEPSMSQEQFVRMQKAMESSLSGSGISFRS